MAAFCIILFENSVNSNIIRNINFKKMNKLKKAQALI